MTSPLITLHIRVILLLTQHRIRSATPHRRARPGHDRIRPRTARCRARRPDGGRLGHGRWRRRAHRSTVQQRDRLGDRPGVTARRRTTRRAAARTGCRRVRPRPSRHRRDGARTRRRRTRRAQRTGRGAGGEGGSTGRRRVGQSVHGGGRGSAAIRRTAHRRDDHRRRRHRDGRRHLHRHRSPSRSSDD